MSPQASTLLGLVLCLGQMIHTQEGAPPKPSLRAEPGPVIPRGQPVTFVCRGPAGADLFRLEKNGQDANQNQKNVPQDGWQGTEARFHIHAVTEHDAGSYRCVYYQESKIWSERSEPLQLQVTEEDVSTPPSGGSQVTEEDVSTQPSGPASQNYSVENSIRLGLAGVVLLILLAILVEAGLSQHRAPQRPQE